MSDQPPIGIIAGGGSLPRLVAQGVRAAGRTPVAVGLSGQYEPELPELCDRFREVGLIRIGQWIRTLRRWGVHEAVMIGRVAKGQMYDPLKVLRYIPDWRAAVLWYRTLRYDRRPATLLGAIANELSRGGIELVDTTRYIPEHLAASGVLTRRSPSAAEEADITFGWPLVRRLNELDIGQAIAVKDCDVIAVEAIEGTDRMVKRAGELCRAGRWTLIKIAKADQDMRFDVPTVGPRTIENLHDAGGACLVVEVGRVILAEKDQLIELADRYGIAIVGRTDADQALAESAQAQADPTPPPELIAPDPTEELD